MSDNRVPSSLPRQRRADQGGDGASPGKPEVLYPPVLLPKGERKVHSNTIGLNTQSELEASPRGPPKKRARFSLPGANPEGSVCATTKEFPSFTPATNSGDATKLRDIRLSPNLRQISTSDEKVGYQFQHRWDRQEGPLLPSSKCLPSSNSLPPPMSLPSLTSADDTAMLSMMGVARGPSESSSTASGDALTSDLQQQIQSLKSFLNHAQKDTATSSSDSISTGRNDVARHLPSPNNALTTAFAPLDASRNPFQYSSSLRRPSASIATLNFDNSRDKGESRSLIDQILAEIAVKEGLTSQTNREPVAADSQNVLHDALLAFIQNGSEKPASNRSSTLTGSTPILENQYNNMADLAGRNLDSRSTGSPGLNNSINTNIEQNAAYRCLLANALARGAEHGQNEKQNDEEQRNLQNIQNLLQSYNNQTLRPENLRQPQIYKNPEPSTQPSVAATNASEILSQMVREQQNQDDESSQKLQLLILQQLMQAQQQGGQKQHFHQQNLELEPKQSSGQHSSMVSPSIARQPVLQNLTSQKVSTTALPIIPTSGMSFAVNSSAGNGATRTKSLQALLDQAQQEKIQQLLQQQQLSKNYQLSQQQHSLQQHHQLMQIQAGLLQHTLPTAQSLQLPQSLPAHTQVGNQMVSNPNTMEMSNSDSISGTKSYKALLAQVERQKQKDDEDALRIQIQVLQQAIQQQQEGVQTQIQRLLQEQKQQQQSQSIQEQINNLAAIRSQRQQALLQIEHGQQSGSQVSTSDGSNESNSLEALLALLTSQRH